MSFVRSSLPGFVVGLVVAASSFAQSQLSPRRFTDSYCRQAADYAHDHQADALLFTATPQNSDPARDKWHRVPSRNDFDTATANADSTAAVTWRSGRVVYVEFSFQNQFGDSTESAEYCYRADGSLAELHSDLKSYHGGLQLRRAISFSADGRPVGNVLDTYDLQTHKEAALPQDFWDLPPPQFMRVSDLPFATELSSPGHAESR